ncbi:MAG: polyprenol phosphomannose-dependent alpha 1,6 mannosyltransferase MptB [Actinobacteria bacterium]|nr:polyprenol phosphomannose-dependent alpha 1,6 mannosyltransferase MptB [Actinomycetota bacterium]MBS1884518.1 polyprenol phosphomannose-dependent alpha 1,6 mannosyltransferase MptB [Actinomycetota bacterium]
MEIATLGPRPSRFPLPRRLGLVGLTGILLTSLLVCLSATQSELLLPTSLRPLPASLAGPLAGAGLKLGVYALIAAFVTMFISYALATRAAEQLRARTVLIAILALHAIVLLAPPLFSSDVFSYEAYGRMGALYATNPYLHGPSAIPLAGLHSLIGAQWVATPSTYGPLFTALSYLLVPLDIAANVIAYKLVAAVSSLILILLVWRAASLRGLSPVRAAVLVGLNPVIVLYGVGGGHNDMMMLAILAAGLYVLLQERERRGGALIVTATAVKLTAGLLLPFALAGRPRGERHARRRLAVGAALCAVAVAALAFAFFGTAPLQLPATLQGIQAEGGPHSIVGFLAAAVGVEPLPKAISVGLTLIFLTVVVWLLRKVWIGEMDWIVGAGWATVALLLTTGFLVPWYVAWLLPLAALSSDRRLFAAAVILTGVGLTTL